MGERERVTYRITSHWKWWEYVLVSLLLGAVLGVFSVGAILLGGAP